MELYNLYFVVLTTLSIIGVRSTKILYGGLLGAGLLWTGLFVLQGIGMYAMAKKQKVEKRWMAFVPFVNLLFMGKLAGECNVFGQKMKRAGLYAMIAQIIATVFAMVEIFAVVYLYTVEGVPSFDQYDNMYWATPLQGFSLQLYKYYTISGLFLPIVQMIYEILIFILTMTLYKKYVPNLYFGLGVLSLFVPLSRFIIIFVIRNRPLVDFEAYMRAKREEFLRQRGYTQYGPTNPNPYANASPTPQQNPEEPFEEFAEDKKTTGQDADDFFS